MWPLSQFQPWNVDRLVIEEHLCFQSWALRFKMVCYPCKVTMGTGSFPGVKRSGRGVDHPPSHLAPRLRKEQRYTSIPPLGLRGLFYGDLYLYLYPCKVTYSIRQQIDTDLMNF